MKTLAGHKLSMNQMVKKVCVQCLVKEKMHTCHDSAIPVTATDPRETPTHAHKESWSTVFISSLSVMETT